MPSDDDITYGLVTDDTATNMPPHPATESQEPLTAVREVHVMPSVDVMTAFVPTATNKLFPYVTACQSESDADVRGVHEMPSADVMTRLPDPVDDTATKRPLPYATPSQSLSAGYPDAAAFQGCALNETRNIAAITKKADAFARTWVPKNLL